MVFLWIALVLAVMFTVNRYVASRNEQLGRSEAGFSKEERERALTQKK